LEVHDTGAGIPEDQIPHIFEKFFQASNQDSAAQAGTGLGLAIARQIVEAHGGSIVCESEPGVGTTFVIVLPAHVQGRRSSAPVQMVAETVA
jgi:signal transduction histidine kinase